MIDKLNQGSFQTSDQLHPYVYIALAGLAFWLVVSAWVLFSQGGYLELDLGVISALVFMIIAIPTVLYFVQRRFHAPDQASSIGHPFRAWMSGDFDMRQGRRKNASAFVEILLPMAAAVIGITAIGIIFRLTEVGGSWL
jgi:cytosine/uracil/thiamine/allantoin permease